MNLRSSLRRILFAAHLLVSPEIVLCHPNPLAAPESISVPPCTADTPVVVFLLDSSTSMGNSDAIQRMTAAVPAAIHEMTEETIVAILQFADRPMLLLPPTLVKVARGRAAEAVREIALRPKTNLVTAMSFAREQVSFCASSQKHFILLTDGAIDEANDCSRSIDDEIPRFLNQNISLSTIMVNLSGHDAFLRKLAKAGKGNFWHGGTRMLSLKKQILKDLRTRFPKRSLGTFDK